MSNVTSKFRLGFGSFIDKVVMPYASMVPVKLKNPCAEGIHCDPPYGFRNQLPLTDNFNEFLDKVKSTNLSGNLDNAEGGFDAMMQVIVCKDEIQWNDMSRKIIIFATDSIFHYAGDGKLGGIIKRNDGQCHLDAQGYYTESIYQDYPSLSQINRAIVDNKINVIFSVPHEALGVYNTLSSLIDGSVAGQLSEDASNVVELIQDNYKKIVSKIELRDNSSDSIEIEYFSRCLNTRENAQKTKSCDGIRFGQKIEFEVKLKLTDCKHQTFNETFLISPLGIKEYIEVQVEAKCSCDCNKPDFALQNSPMCSKGGDLVCGICNCYQNRHGKNCECIGNSELEKKKLKECQRDLNTTTYCSNRGECSCGECICKKGPTKQDKIFGKYCECDTFTCAKDDKGRTCGGRGKCCNGACLCDDGWTGYTCDCTSNVTSCVNPVNQKVCSGNGDCVCGSCECNKNTNSSHEYAGRFCEECATCEGKCADLEPLIDFESGTCNYSRVKQCPFQLNLVDELNVTTNKNEKKCVIYDKDDCQKVFSYRYDEATETMVVLLKKGRDCRSEVNVWLVIAYIVIAILVIGLIILFIWRLAVYLEERRAAKQHVKLTNEQLLQMKTREQNPIYKAPINLYNNPTYGQQKS
ncbi:hypothetical protein B4U80_10561 [Leptotrombidium deliense]|uniref:Integrin beta n=1 Tax=Leptotrombidium deliense TaxID=299467 RepID=A0A443SNA3_9ACAR|nr:hypothetical protein B4U80_10561 [Leptotrombidium deliense]